MGTTSQSLVILMGTSRIGCVDPVVHVARHTCGRGAAGCCTPHHLVPGDRSQNAADRRVHNGGRTLPERPHEHIVNLDVLTTPFDHLQFLADLEGAMRRVQSVGDGCWVVDPWPGAEKGGGRDWYRRLRVAGVVYGMHALVAQLDAGRVTADGEEVLHRCGRKQCLHFRHLRLGTPSENRREAVEHGHLPKGLAHPRTALTEESLTTIRELGRDGRLNYPSIAEAAGVPEWSARRVATGDFGDLPAVRGVKRNLTHGDIEAVRWLAGFGVSRSRLVAITGLTRGYVVELLRGRQRPSAGGPVEDGS